MDDEERVLKPPYWRVTYIDSDNKTHLAEIDSKEYLDFLISNFTIVNIQKIDKI